MSAHIIVFAGSNRTGAYSGQAADAAVKYLKQRGAQVTRVSLTDYPMPIFDEDIEQNEGYPEATKKLARLISDSDGVVIASPEYNASVTPLLKNTLDWLSRVKKDEKGEIAPFKGTFTGIIGSSPGGLGGIRGLEHLRAILRNIGAEVLTTQVAIGGAHESFNDEGLLKNERQEGMMTAMCDALIKHAK